jgi:hypothetical protein
MSEHETVKLYQPIKVVEYDYKFEWHMVTLLKAAMKNEPQLKEIVDFIEKEKLNIRIQLFKSLGMFDTVEQAREVFNKQETNDAISQAQ